MNKYLVELFGKRKAVTLDASKVPPILRDWLNLTTRSTDCNPGLLITALLPHLGVTLGNRVFMLSNSNRIFPNIWSCLIGPSSVSRKTTAINYAQPPSISTKGGWKASRWTFMNSKPFCSRTLRSPNSIHCSP